MPRSNHTIRLGDAAIAAVQRLAKQHSTTKAVVLRAMFAVATMHPEDVAKRIEETKNA